MLEGGTALDSLLNNRPCSTMSFLTYRGLRSPVFRSCNAVKFTWTIKCWTMRLLPVAPSLTDEEDCLKALERLELRLYAESDVAAIQTRCRPPWIVFQRTSMAPDHPSSRSHPEGSCRPDVYSSMGKRFHPATLKISVKHTILAMWNLLHRVI